MSAPVTGHPDPARLRQYAHGGLDAESSAQVAKHLETCAQCLTQFTAISATSSGKSIPKVKTEKSVSNSTPPPPELENHPQYEYIRELGRGGMGVVYLVRNRMLDRVEVLKVVNKELLAKPGAQERFVREMRAAAKLNHPNLVTAFAAMPLGDSLAFAMEFVDGRDLAAIVKTDGAVAVRTACQYTRMAALGLQHAYENGMVHRDIKPSNLMLARSGERGEKITIKVLDFGLAKASSEKELDSDLTGAGKMLGTPDYMAPEQIIDAATAKTPADIYSLGGTLYYLLAGRPPYSGVKSLAELLDAHRFREPVSLEELRNDVPPGLSAVISKMMAKKPADRYQTPREVFQALEPFTKAVPPAAPSATVAKAIPATAAPVAPVAVVPIPVQSAPIPDASFSFPAIVDDEPRRGEKPHRNESAGRRKEQGNKKVMMLLGIGGGAFLALLTLGGIALWASGVFSSKPPAPVASAATDPKPKPTRKTTPPSSRPADVGNPVTPNPNQPRFRDRGAYCEDSKTGLLWQKDGIESGKKNFQQAAEYAASLRLGGVAGWRVPTREELAAIYPAIEAPFTNTRYNPNPFGQGPGTWESYWTSDLDTRREDYAYIYQWYGNGVANNCTASRTFTFVRCVRDPLNAPVRPPMVNPNPPVVPPTVMPPDAPLPDGFVSLFNGRDMDQWRDTGPRKYWVVEEGLLVPSQNIGPLSTKRADYANFHLQAVVSVLEPNYGGLIIRSNEMSFMRQGYTIQLGNSSSTVFPTNTGSIKRNESFGWNGLGFQSPERLAPPDRWFKIEVVADGGVITTFIDGRKIGEYIDPAPAPPGTITLFFPSQKPAVRFRSIAIKELPPSKPVEKPVLTVVPGNTFAPLFGGNGLAGWVTHPSLQNDWVFAEGVLQGRCLSQASVLYTDRDDFTDVHIRGEFQVSDGAAGLVMARTGYGPSNAPVTPWLPGGYQFPVNVNGPGLAKTGSVIIPPRSQESHLAPEYISRIPPGKSDEWSKLEVIVSGGTMVTLLDGQVASRVSDASNKYPRGRIAIGLNSANGTIKVRNLEIKQPGPLPPVQPLPKPDETPKWAPGADGFTALFNGKDLKGWELPDKGKWTVSNGVLNCSSPGEGSISFTPTMMKYTKPMPANFHLRAEVVSETIPDAGGTIILRAHDDWQTFVSLSMGNTYNHPPGAINMYRMRTSSGLLTTRVGYPSNNRTTVEFIVRGRKARSIVNGEIGVDRDLNPDAAKGTGLALGVFRDGRMRILSLGIKEIPE